MEKGMNSCSWFSVLEKESSSNTDFLAWMKTAGAGPGVSIMANPRPPFARYDDGGGGGVGANEAATVIYRDQLSSCCGGGGGGHGGGGSEFPFTNSQWKELERQAMIYKCMISSVPVPPHLLFPLDSSVICNFQTRRLHFHIRFLNNTFFDLDFEILCVIISAAYGGRYSRKGDLEPGRCKRTDGKKWRCSREVAPLQKYCDRHLHRGRPRSRKPVELNKKTRLQQNKNPPSAAIEGPLPSKTDLAISTPCYMETDRDLPWENLMEADYKSSFDQDFAVQQPLNLFSYPNFPSQATGFIDAWSIENLNSRSVESSISLSEGDLSPSLSLSMAMAVGEVLDEQMRNIETEAPGGIEKTIWWEGGGPLGEALQQGASTPASPYNSLGTPATTVSSPSGVLYRTLFSHSDGSVCNSPTALAAEIPNHWNFFP